MTMYEYECALCKTRFEVHQSIYDERFQHHNEAEEIDCQGTLSRVFSNLQFNLHQGQSEVIHTDDRGSKITRHWNGRQDAYVVPEPTVTKTLEGD